MDEVFFQNEENRIVDFATTQRIQWEKNHQLYSVIMELTPKCNFNCVHCYLHDHHASKEMSYEEIINIIDILYKKEVLFITLTGGEIFTRKDFLDIYMYAKKKGFIIELYTNCFGLTDEIVEVFKKYPPLLVDVSLYGSNDETYYKVTGVKNAYTRVTENIKKLIEANVRVSIKAPVINLYFDELPEFKAFAEKYNLPFRTGFEIYPTIDNDGSVQDYAVPLKQSMAYEFKRFEDKPRTFGEEWETELVDLQKQRPLFRCKLGRASCAIGFDGKMLPCMSFRHAGIKLTEENFEDIWKKFGEYPKLKASENYKCLKCKAYDFCDICPAMMQAVHGDLEYVEEHFCKAAHARYEHYLLGKAASEVLEKL